jgi:NADH-quinone oxidoreductase subunit J
MDSSQSLLFFAQALDASNSTMATTAKSALDKVGAPDWHLLAFICIAFGAVGYYLLQRGLLHSRSMATVGFVLFAAAGILAVATQKPNFEKAILFAFCGLSLAGGVTFLTARQSVHAALGFATTILASAGVIFMQSALFVASATIIVYAGATIIIFLFVLMFSQQQVLETYELKLNRPFLAALTGGVLLAVLVAGLQSIESVSWDHVAANLTRPLSATEANRPIPGLAVGLGRAMFTEYLITVELAGAILLAATIGAIAMAQRTREVE